MADQHKENLRKLLDFLEAEIIHNPENRWFVDELYNRLPNKPVPHSEDYSKIEKYLGLDYRLDTCEIPIDYSFVNDQSVESHLNSDWREMMRYRFGTRGHQINFPEFCRYAMMQIERMVNLYYYRRGNNMNERIAYIKRFNPSYNPKNKKGELPCNVEAINFCIKLWALNTEFGIEGLKKGIEKIAKVRNIRSHGSSQPDADEIFFRKHYDALSAAHYPLKPCGTVDWNRLSENMVLKNIYETTIKNTVDHQKYIDLAWQRQELFDEVTATVRGVKSLLRQHM